MKHVFVIPSWYPSAEDPVSGIFVRKQAEAMSALGRDFRPVVGLWGQCDENIPLNHPMRISAWLRSYARRPRGEWSEVNGVEIVADRTVAWSHRLPFGGSPRLLEVTRRNLRRAIERHGRIDLVHAYVTYPAGHVASIVAREFGLPFVITEFMGPFPFPAHAKPDGDVRDEIRQAQDRCDGSIVLSEYLRRRFLELRLAEPAVIPFSVDHSRFAPRPRPDDGFIEAVCCCRIVKEKGVFELVSALALARRTHPNLRLKLIGTGPAAQDLKQHATQSGVADAIEWTGQLDNDAVAQALSTADFFALPSRFDTFGVAYIEAMASGLPIIATRCGGPEGFIGEAQGMLVDVGNVEQLAAAFDAMCSRLRTYDRSGIRAYSSARFSDQTVVAALEDFYAGVLERQGRRAAA